MPKEQQPQTYEELGQVELLRRQLAEARKELRERSVGDAGSLAIAEAIRETVPTRPAVPPGRAPRLTKNRLPVAGILDLGDWHYGEVVDFESTGGVYQYNPSIAAERFDHTVDQAIELGREHKIGELVVILGGDMISGNIHDDLNRTNESMVVNQTLEMAEIVTGGIDKVSSAFSVVRALSVSGNHPRLEKIPHFKHKQTENLDYMLDQIVQLMTKKQGNLEWLTRKSFWNNFEVEGRRFLTMHGDTNKQQNSMGISFYAIEKELRKYMGLVNDGTIPHFHDMITHHQHTLAAIPVGGAMNYINGSGKGGDEYSLAGSRPPSPARQRFLAVSQGKVVADRAIELDHIGRPDTTEFYAG
jgi:hypothetical protein